MTKIIAFPDDKIVRQKTTVSLLDIQRFLHVHQIAEDAGATFNEGGSAVAFETGDDFATFIKLLYEKGLK